MYAIANISGKQYKVQVNDTVLVDRLSAEIGEELSFPVLMIVEPAAQLLKIVWLRLKFWRTFRTRKSPFSNTKPKRTSVKNKVIVNHTQKLQ